MPAAITVENLSKKYLIRHQRSERYTALRDVLAERARSIFSGGESVATSEEFWALKDVNFEIQEGDRVGIIGRNGAGKSTLLKILSRVTEPTTGRITTRGRVASLLEVGTGFHPELTGRENIYLNGAILGMQKAEIRKKFDEIVDFAEVERFLDTPVKRFSSGMQVRLAFAVAAHLEPDIMIVDEVLAVGDVRFQKKCLGKMEQVGREGRTVLFVSHNTQAILRLCDSAIMLVDGQVSKSGNSREVIAFYLRGGASVRSSRSWPHDRAPGDRVVRLRSLRAVTERQESKSTFQVSEKLGIEMSYEVLQPGHVLWLGYNFHNGEGINLFDAHSVNTPMYEHPHPVGVHSATAWVPANLLAEGGVIVGCAIFNHLENRVHFHEREAIALTIVDSCDGTTARGRTTGEFPGAVRPLLQWEIRTSAGSALQARGRG
jgi:lipopolysaccharide transport system ATP-binding protein